MRGVGRWVVRVLGVALGGVIALAVVLAVRLSRGPIDLDALSPYLAGALSAPDGEWRASVGGTELAWDAEEDDLDLVVRDVELTAREGGAIASVPSLSVRFHIAPLFRGELRLSSVDVMGPKLTVRRGPDGAWDVSTGGAKRPEQSGPVRMLPTPAQGGPESIEIRHAEVSVEDAVSGLSARLADAHLDVRWSEETRLGIELEGNAAIGEQAVRIRLAFTRDGMGPANVEASVDPVGLVGIGEWLAARTRPDASAAPSGLDRAATTLKQVRLSAGARIRAELDPRLVPVRAEVALDAGKGEIDVPAPVGIDVALARGEVRVRWQASDGAIEVDTLALDFGGTRFSASGRRDGLGVFSAEAALHALPIGDLAAYWPPSAARGARAWLTANLTVGRVDEASVEIAGIVSDEGAVDVKRLDGKVSFHDLTVRYLDTMPPATAVKGGGTFDLHAWKLHVDAGRVGDVGIVPASVTISKVAQPGTRIDVHAKVRGPLPSVLATLDHPPLLVPQHMGIVPAKTSGKVDGTLSIGVPLDDHRRKRDVDVDARANVTGGALPDAVGDWPVTDADLQVAVRDDDVDVKGTLRLAGVPVRAESHEVVGNAALRRIVVTSRANARELKGLGLDATEWVEGPLGIEVVLGTRGPDTVLVTIDPTRAKLDLWPIGLLKAPGTAGSMTATIELPDRKLRAIAPARLVVGSSVVTVRAARDADGKWGQIDAQAHVVQPTGAVDYTLVATPAGMRHDVHVTCTDAAAVMRSLGRDVESIGGKVSFDGQIGINVPGTPLNGRIGIARVTVMRAPILQTLLNVASVEGIVDTFKRGGLVFEDVTLDVVHEGTTTRLTDVFMHGPFLVITGQGTIVNGELALRGSLVPSYFGLNRVARRIPVIGQILTGTSGEGIACVDFRIEGPAAHPKVRVSPSSLGPGIVRDLLRKLSG